MNLLERLVPIAHYEAKVEGMQETEDDITVTYKIRKTPKTSLEGMNKDDRVFLTVSRLEPVKRGDSV